MIPAGASTLIAPQTANRPDAGAIAPEDARFMRAALAIGRRTRGLTWPNPAVGAVIVREIDGQPVIVGRGATAPSGRPHAEILALRQAGDAAKGATAYVTLEPCAHWGRSGPCAVALAEHGVRRVVVGASDINPRVKDKGVEILRAAGVEVVMGVLARECHDAHIGHFRRFAERRPQVQLKLAISRDGFIGRREGSQIHITGPEIQRFVHVMRAEADGILVGLGTVLNDDPDLTCRLEGMEDRSPIRFVLDSTARLPLGSNLVRTAREVPVKLITTPAAPIERTSALMAAGVEIITVAEDEHGRVQVPAALGALAHRGITRLMVEGGGATAGSFVAAGLVDEAYLSFGPVDIGEGGVPPLGPVPLETLTKDPHFELRDQCVLGQDRLIHLWRP
ncbi:bifunctional diaminohydroxyphosphoribosylaminopyrimidine deaminase/5-amino-6-(5-phosphoribosylamino)uracil reductase RibD [Breoghania sp. L-A4]|uniref:bifunctional diaminohydroxyphosphoribosylaminopyrimidine deaminase/5-amino-6-(5-phosphoribosylamino)uracil reductase RibD n=1 Tax=Breoghania sp. L-A4 TaxID=2304600 RepID=UPI0020BDBBDA|nr:bifunctional diaminohydroxyphosphoribosylaminopyrimidine deaminase/5-amino-6-(5-phosphoribosylamino)uracil reductase RibD [Breoghania sp. L-A4]